MADILSKAGAKFAGALSRLTDGGFSNGTLGLAVSGGPDSLAMLLIAHRAIPGQFKVATVDHGLRAEAAEEASYVAKICAERGIAHATLRPDQPITGNIQSAAREARYALLQDWAAANGLQWTATAHHADDQLETLLMRLGRGSGVSGMSGIRARNRNIIRPLLEFRKTDLIAICAAEGVEPCHDPSNDRTEFDRVRIRQWLASAPDMLDPAAANRTAGAVADANAALEWSAQQLEADHRMTAPDGSISLNITTLPRELQRRLLVRALQLLDPDLQTRGPTIDRALDQLSAGEKLTIGNILCSGGATWQLRPAPPRNKSA
jgi:tRNA(Ile)-lysidine synthase